MCQWHISQEDDLPLNFILSSTIYFILQRRVVGHSQGQMKKLLRVHSLIVLLIICEMNHLLVGRMCFRKGLFTLITMISLLFCISVTHH